MNAWLLAVASRDFSLPVGFFPIVIIFGGQTPGDPGTGDPGTGDPHSPAGGASGTVTPAGSLCFVRAAPGARGVMRPGVLVRRRRPGSSPGPAGSSGFLLGLDPLVPLMEPRDLVPLDPGQGQQEGCFSRLRLERAPLRGLLVAGRGREPWQVAVAPMPRVHLILVASHTLSRRKCRTCHRGASRGGRQAAGGHLPVAAPRAAQPRNRAAWPSWGGLPLRAPRALHPGRLPRTLLTASSSQTPLLFVRSQSKRREK